MTKTEAFLELTDPLKIKAYLLDHLDSLDALDEFYWECYSLIGSNWIDSVAFNGMRSHLHRSYHEEQEAWLNILRSRLQRIRIDDKIKVLKEQVQTLEGQLQDYLAHTGAKELHSSGFVLNGMNCFKPDFLKQKITITNSLLSDMMVLQNDIEPTLPGLQQLRDVIRRNSSVFSTEDLKELKKKLAKLGTNSVKSQEIVLQETLQLLDNFSPSATSVIPIEVDERFQSTDPYLSMLLQALIDQQFIDDKTTKQQWKQLFSPSSKVHPPITWKSSSRELKHLFLRLNKAGVIYFEGQHYLKTICSHFVTPVGTKFDPQKLRKSITPTDSTRIEWVLKALK